MIKEFNWVNRVKKEIIICPECKGNGEVIAPLKYKYCPSCEGTGRLLKTITYKAYEESST